MIFGEYMELYTHEIQLSKRELLCKIKIAYVGEKWGRFKGKLRGTIL